MKKPTELLFLCAVAILHQHRNFRLNWELLTNDKNEVPKFLKLIKNEKF